MEVRHARWGSDVYRINASGSRARFAMRKPLQASTERVLVTKVTVKSRIPWSIQTCHQDYCSGSSCLAAKVMADDVFLKSRSLRK